MRFDSEAYDKLYPRPVKETKVETAVEGFTPSAKKDEEIAPETVVETTETEVEDGRDGTDSSTSK